MTIYPQDYIKIKDVTIQQQYSSNKNIPDKISIPIHEGGNVVPKEPNLCMFEAKIEFNSDNIIITFPHAKNETWINTVIENIQYYLTRVYDISINENDIEIDYEYGIPHPCLNTDKINTILSLNSTYPNINGVYNKIIKYELSNGNIYLDMNENTVKISSNKDSTESNLVSELNTQLMNDIQNRLKNLDMKLFNPNEDIFDISVLYPALIYDKEIKIEFWNMIANDLFTRDLINEPTPRLRLLCEEMNFEGIKASMIWLEFMSTLAYEIPILGNTVPYISELGSVNLTPDDIIWKNSLAKFNNLYQQLDDVAEHNLGYNKNLIPDSDIIKIHANNEHQILAAEPILYGPVVPLSNKNIENIDDYFWSEKGWWLKIKGARPCDSLDGEFNTDEIKKYWEDKNEYILADKRNLESSTAITEAEINSSMVILRDE